MNEFLKKIKVGAISGQKKYGVLASLTMAQAALETGWGNASVGNNVFGIKADASWTGPTTEAPTQEWYGGKYVTVTAGFRAYASVDASVEDHAKFLAENSRYHNIIGCTDYRQACRNIQADGYATDPNYAEKLISIIEQNDLHQFDIPAVDSNYCDTTDLTLCPGIEYTFKTGTPLSCANSALIQTSHEIGTDGYHYTTLKAQALCAGVGIYVNGSRKCIAVVKQPTCDTATLTQNVGQTYQFKTNFPLTCANGAIWQQQGLATHQNGFYYTKFKAAQKGTAGFYCGSTRVCVGTVI